MKPILAILPLMAAISLSACAAAQGGDYPSLAKRPVEGRFDVAPPSVVVPPPGPLPIDLAGRLARWESDAAGERSIAESVDGLPEIYALRDKLAAMLAAQVNVLAGLERQLPGQ